jgi:hypothetical protein
MIAKRVTWPAHSKTAILKSPNERVPKTPKQHPAHRRSLTCVSPTSRSNGGTCAQRHVPTCPHATPALRITYTKTCKHATTCQKTLTKHVHLTRVPCNHTIDAYCHAASTWSQPLGGARLEVTAAGVRLKIARARSPGGVRMKCAAQS